MQVKDSSGNILKTYTYDGLHRRISEMANGTTTDFYYSDAWQVLEERVASGETFVEIGGIGMVARPTAGCVRNVRGVFPSLLPTERDSKSLSGWMTTSYRCGFGEYCYEECSARGADRGCCKEPVIYTAKRQALKVLR